MATDESKVEEIFFCALGKGSAEELAAYLDEACEGDDPLRNRVQRLLDAKPKLGSFLQGDAGNIIATVDQPITEKPGTQIGPYKLLQQLGEGGMGVVYMAEQKEPFKRRVALKIIKPGMDTRQVIARFEAERQALAMMDHPNIAKVLDAGATESSRPYFVMELVNGLPVTKYCDEQHLTPKERLELFVPICQAVQHAHQKGIIHRDLKPSNILVAMYDNKAVPKIIDFGVAKATSQSLTEKTMFTQLGQVVGTLEYMSPEQAQRNQLDIDTRSDIYSLGVVLYELLTGETPFDRERLRSAAFDEMLRIIREEEPSKPSTKVNSSQSLPSIAANRRIEPAKLGSMMRGELDWIVLKAMEKDRGRRYETASKFAEDVQHYLNDEAVVACPPSRGYRFHKFARRNKVPVTLAGMAILALVSLAVSGFVLAFSIESQAQRRREVTEQRAIADARLVDALSNLEAAIDRAEAAGLSDDNAWFAAQQARQPAQILAAAESVNPGLVSRVRAQDEWFEQFERDRTLLDRLSRIRLAQANASILENRFTTENALPEYAELFADEGLDLSRISAREAAQRLAHRRMEVRCALVAALNDWRGIGEWTDHPQTMHVKALLQVLDDEKSDVLGNNSKTLSGTDDLHELAEEVESSELVVARQTPYDLSAMGKVLCDRAEYWEIGIDLLRQAQRHYPNDFWINHDLGSRLASRPAHRQEGVEYLQVAVALRPDSAGPRLNLGTALLQLKRLREAVAVYRKTLEIEPNYLIAHRQLGIALRELGEWDQAVDEFRQALELDPDGLEAPYIYAHMGFALMMQGKLDECIRYSRMSLELDPNEIVALNALAMSFLKQGKLEESSELLHKALNVDAKDSATIGNLGFVLQQQGRFAEAITQHRAAIEIDPGNTEAYNNLGLCLKEQGELAEAIRCYRKAIELDPGDSLAFNNLAAALLVQGKNEEAVACLRKAIELSPKDAEFHVNLGLALASQGKLDEAINCYRQAITINPEWARAYLAMGNAMMDLGKPVEEIECYRHAIRISETHENLKPIDLALIHTNLGLALFSLGNEEEAVAHYRKAIEATPTYTHAHIALGTALSNQGDYDQAIACLRKAIELDPTLVQGHVNLGVAHALKGDSIEAIQCFSEALKYAPDDLDALHNLSVMLTEGPDPEVQNPREALEYARRAVRLDAAMPRNWTMLAIVAFRAGEWEESLNAWKEKTLRQPLVADEQLFLAMTLWHLGDNAEARKLLQEAVVEIEGMENPDESIKRHQKEAEELITSIPTNSGAIPNSEMLDR